VVCLEDTTDRAWSNAEKYLVGEDQSFCWRSFLSAKLPYDKSHMDYTGSESAPGLLEGIGVIASTTVHMTGRAARQRLLLGCLGISLARFLVRFVDEEVPLDFCASYLNSHYHDTVLTCVYLSAQWVLPVSSVSVVSGAISQYCKCSQRCELSVSAVSAVSSVSVVSAVSAICECCQCHLAQNAICQKTLHLHTWKPGSWNQQQLSLTFLVMLVAL
jgi:hypothetical protein